MSKKELFKVYLANKAGSLIFYCLILLYFIFLLCIHNIIHNNQKQSICSINLNTTSNILSTMDKRLEMSNTGYQINHKGAI